MPSNAVSDEVIRAKDEDQEAMVELDSNLRSDHLSDDLKGRAVRGGAVTMVAQAAKFFLQIGSTIVLARLLTPADFGLVAMVGTFTIFIGLFKDLGLSTATIQRAEITHAQLSALFWINLAISILLTIASMLLAPVAAWLFGEPRLKGIMLVSATAFIASGLAAQHLALLRRQMRFMALASIEVVSMVAGIGAAIAVAWAGGGYWALVAMLLVTGLVTFAMAWHLSKWQPGWPRFDVDLDSILRFGGNLTIFDVSNFLSRGADNALIGWAWGPGPLGLYSRAYGLLRMPLNQVNAPLSAVVIPTLSRLQHDPQQYRRYYCRMANLITYATIPMLAGLAALSDEVIALVLGNQWSEASSIFAILAVSGIGQPLLWTAAWVHISLGRTYRLRNWGLITDPLCVMVFVLGLSGGPIGVATCYAVYVNLIVLPGMFYAFRDSPVRMRDMFSAVWCPMLFSAAVFAGAAVGRSFGRSSGDLWALLYGGSGALACGLLFVALVPRGRAELWSLWALTSYLKRSNR